MKNIIIIAAIVASTFTASSQGLPNASFEDTLVTNDTVNMTTDTTVVGWSMSNFGAGVTADAYTGNTAVCVWNWYYYALGEIANGNGIFPDKGGTPINFRPNQLKGYYKYIPGDVSTQNDSAQVIVVLSHFNTNTMQRDTVGYGYLRLPQTNSYTLFNVDINYSNTIQPDTIAVRFTSSVSGFCNVSTNCLFFYIDDVEVINTVTGISEGINMNAFNVYPNPVSNYLNISLNDNEIDKTSTIEIFNSLGEKVIVERTNNNNRISINVAHLVEGIYIVKYGEGFSKILIK